MNINKQMLERFLDDLVVSIVMSEKPISVNRGLRRMHKIINRAEAKGYSLKSYREVYISLCSEYKGL